MTAALTPPPNTELRQVPAAAFEFSAPCELMVGDRQDDLTPISILARSPEPIDHWYWGRLVHDFDGMAHPARIALDYCHDQYEPLGFGDKFDVDAKGLTVSGSVVHHREGDLADKITHKAKRGVPFEASIFFSAQPDDLHIEFIPEGAFAEANGREYQGPVFIARQSFLRGLAVCLYGYDRHTQSRLTSDPDRTIDVLIATIGAEMTTKTNRTKLTDDAAPQDAPPENATTADDAGTGGAGSPPPDDAKQDETPASQDRAVETGDDRSSDAGSADASASAPAPAPAPTGAGSLSRKELRAYLDAFGSENGAQWALEGKSLAECHQLHAQSLQTQLTAARQETASLREKLASLSTGEDEPAKFSADAKDATTGGDATPAPPTELAMKIGPNLARIASGITIPPPRN